VSRPVIGIFDSGFGGLTVMRALLALIPQADYVYLGDTARLPYGSKSRETIARYAVGSAHFLEAHGADLLVIACNTASALALDALEAEAKIPVLGVIEPGADAAARAATPGHSGVLVLATQATVQSHAYARACAAHGLQAYEKACPLLVPLVEEGWTDHSVTEEVLRLYLEEALSGARAQGILPTTVLLGCSNVFFTNTFRPSPAPRPSAFWTLPPPQRSALPHVLWPLRSQKLMPPAANSSPRTP